MPPTRSATLRLVRISAAIVGVCVIAAYAAWRSFDYARGPAIFIDNPKDGSYVEATSTTISGKAERVTRLTLNGFDIGVNEQGDFHETLLLFPGVNRLLFSADDRFGRHTEKGLELLH